MKLIINLLLFIIFNQAIAALVMPYDQVRLYTYNPTWRYVFMQESKVLADTLDKTNIVKIEHFGSTSVVGMVAKPVIDILVGLKNLKLREEDFIRLFKMGYNFIEKSPYCERYYFHRRDRNKINLNITRYGSQTWDTCLAVRDYLRTHPEDRTEYINAKLNALAMGYNSIDKYSLYKFNLVVELKNKALAWRQQKN